MKNRETKFTLNPLPLTSMSQICDKFRRGPKVVKAWVDAGAPIVQERTEGGLVRYMSEYNRLLDWLLEQNKFRDT